MMNRLESSARETLAFKVVLIVVMLFGLGILAYGAGQAIDRVRTVIGEKVGTQLGG